MVTSQLFRIHQRPHTTAGAVFLPESDTRRGLPADRKTGDMKACSASPTAVQMMKWSSSSLTLLLPTVANTSGSPSLLCQLNWTPNSGWPWSSCTNHEVTTLRWVTWPTTCTYDGQVKTHSQTVDTFERVSALLGLPLALPPALPAWSVGRVGGRVWTLNVGTALHTDSIVLHTHTHTTFIIMMPCETSSKLVSSSHTFLSAKDVPSIQTQRLIS